MKIENISYAMCLKDKLANLESQYRMVSSGKGLGVTIQSTYQDDAFVDAIRSSAERELSKRIKEVKAQLVGLGVTFD